MPDIGTDTGTETEPNIDSNADTGLDTESSLDTESGLDTESIVDGGADGAVDVDTDIDTDTDTDTGSDMDTDTDIDTDTDTDTDSDTDTYTDIDTESDTDTGTDTGADTDTDSSLEGCIIEGEFFEDGDKNPENACQKCDISFSTAGWSDDDGADCEDNLFCTVDDTCFSGACFGEERDCDDDTFCNGVEYCLEDTNECVSSGDPCVEQEQCFEDENQCCTPESYQGCSDEQGDVVWFDSCGHEGALIEDCLDINGACKSGACGCLPGWFGETCDQCIVFVDGITGDDLSDGTSWGNAVQTVQGGLDLATVDHCDIWVAAGTYYPNEGLSSLPNDERMSSFRLRPHVGLYGGFSGTETNFEERDIERFETVLSGNIGMEEFAEDNAYHVVTGADYAIIDGFTITSGNANHLENYIYGEGGGMYNFNVSPTVIRCHFKENFALNNGGGMNNRNSLLMVTNCTFEDNDTGGTGGGMANQGGSPEVINCTFEGNSANDRGGGMHNTAGSKPIVSNCTFENNSAALQGGGLYNTSSSDTTITDCSFLSNTTVYDGGGIRNYNSTVVVINSYFSDNKAFNGDGGAIHSRNSFLTIFNSSFVNNVAADVGAGLRFLDSTGMLTNCVISSNQAGADGGGFYIDNSSVSIRNCTIVNNTAGDDGGGIWNNESSPDVKNTIIWGNSAVNLGSQVYNENNSNPTIEYSTIEGDCPVPECTTSAVGNIHLNPMFVDEDAADYRLTLDSPCINRGDNAGLPLDLADLDNDEDVGEVLPLDLAGNERVIDQVVDMGAFENQEAENLDAGIDIGIDSGL